MTRHFEIWKGKQTQRTAVAQLNCVVIHAIWIMLFVCEYGNEICLFSILPLVSKTYVCGTVILL